MTKRHYNQYRMTVSQVSQRALDEQPRRLYLSIRNPDANNSVWLRIRGTATSGPDSYEIPARSAWEPNPAPPVEWMELVTAPGVTVDVNIMEGVEDAQD